MSKKTNDKVKNSLENVVWDLSELYSSHDDPKLLKDIETAIKLADEFRNKYYEKIKTTNDSKFLLNAFIEYEKCFEIASKFMQFAFLNFSLDTSNKEAKTLLALCDEKYTEIENKLLFFKLELCQIEDNVIKKLCLAEELKNYVHQIEIIRNFKPYQLSEKEEQIIKIKDLNAKNYVVQLYDELTASFRFKIKMPDGKTYEMTGSEIRNLRYHPEPNIRKQASKLFLKKYIENSLTISSLYNMIIRDHYQECKLRGFKRADEPRNISNELSNSIIDTLVSVTTKNTHIVQKYYKLKAKLLKVKKLNLYDIYAPITSKTKTYSFDEAKEIVFTSFKKFDESFYKMALDMFNKNRIDAKLRPNKKSGAYCSSSVPNLYPFVLLNFVGNLREVMTLAHELGHAIHSILSSKNTILNFHASLPLCETASIFAESIVTDALLKEMNKDEKIALIASKLEDYFATSFRQNMFTRFEFEAHKQCIEKVLSKDDLSEIYFNELQVMFGDSVKINDEYCYEWSVIPHIFHTPFYCYSYNFGLLLVLALYQKYCEEGDKFKQGFFKLLSLGSSVAPEKALNDINIDITKAEFWQKGFDYILNKVNELEKLIEN